MRGGPDGGVQWHRAQQLQREWLELPQERPIPASSFRLTTLS